MYAYIHAYRVIKTWFCICDIPYKATHFFYGMQKLEPLNTCQRFIKFMLFSPEGAKNPFPLASRLHIRCCMILGMDKRECGSWTVRCSVCAKCMVIVSF